MKQVVQTNKLLMFPMGLLLLTQVGCETLSYYGQAVQGQWQILRARQPVAEQLLAADLPAQTRSQLQLSQRVLDFAENRLHMPSDGRYRSYVALDREFVVWNVFAAEEYDLQGKQWCYPVVGCAPYRGYFKEQNARSVASRYARQGLEVYVGPVPAYSTLGWFKDPLLSSFLSWPEADLVQLLVHELAHSKVWLKDDVAFNESFASFVGEQGAAEWFHSQQRTGHWQAYLQEQQQWRRLRGLLIDAKQVLAQSYAANKGDATALARGKTATLAALRGCYEEHKTRLGAGRYDHIVAALNNAYLVSVGTYEDWVPVMRLLFQQHDEDWEQFFAAVQALADEPASQRRALSLIHI